MTLTSNPYMTKSEVGFELFHDHVSELTISFELEIVDEENVAVVMSVAGDGGEKRRIARLSLSSMSEGVGVDMG